MFALEKPDKWMMGKMLTLPAGVVPLAQDAGGFVACLKPNSSVVPQPDQWILYNPKLRVHGDAPSDLQIQVVDALLTHLYPWHNNDHGTDKARAESLGTTVATLAGWRSGELAMTVQDASRLLLLLAYK